MTSPRQLMLVATCAIFVAPPAFAQDDSEAAAPAGFGGPDAVANKMADDNLSLNEWRQNLKEDYGFSFSLDYTSVVLSANETFSDSTGAGGIARAYGTWDLWNDGAGTMVWKFEHRHAYGDTSPFDSSMVQMGYVGLQEPPFNDTDFRKKNLYWRLGVNGGRSHLLAGIFDATD